MYKCSKCSRKFENFLEMEMHKKTHAMLTCPVCPSEYSHRSSLLKHKNKKHPELKAQKNEFICDLCYKDVGSKDGLISHKRAHIAEDVCKDCGRFFTDKRELNEHLARPHANKSGEYTIQFKALVESFKSG
ncbi:unnamed protein product [Caenorhabditis sp. 36 PRJEB53466]|nr:unnamed protein product [Caenorhabditis sp. 36 PRJEB53466]